MYQTMKEKGSKQLNLEKIRGKKKGERWEGSEEGGFKKIGMNSERCGGWEKGRMTITLSWLTIGQRNYPP